MINNNLNMRGKIMINKNKKIRSKKIVLSKEEILIEKLDKKVKSRINSAIYREPTIEWDKERGYACNYAGNIAEKFAPTDKRGQWKIIAGEAGAGKSTLLRKYYNMLVANFSEEEVAVFAVYEREDEIRKLWHGVKNLYTITNREGLPKTLFEKFIRMIYKIHCNEKIKAVIVDGMTGVQKFINVLPNIKAESTDTGGIKYSVEDYINLFVIEPLRTRIFEDTNEYSRDRIVISSMIINPGLKGSEALFAKLQGVCDSELVLSKKIANQGLYPAIDVPRCISRDIDHWSTGGNLKDYLLNKKIGQPILKYAINWQNTD